MIAFYIGFFGWLLFIALAVWINWFKIDIRGIKPTYLNSNWARVILGLACLVLMTKDSGFDPLIWYTWIPVLPHVVYIASSFYLFFDPWLNHRRGKDLDYRGKDSGWLDKLGTGWYYSLKVLCLIGLVVSIIMIW